jgi:RsmE family RNA methyltransferase
MGFETASQLISCLTKPEVYNMNIILFETHELERPLPRRDERTVHLLKVLHKKPGDSFEAGLLGGGRGTGRIEAVRLDGSLSFSLDLGEDPPPRFPIRIAVGFPRPIQLRRLLRDLSNLGIGAIDLMGTELGEKSYRDTKLLIDGGVRAALIEGAVQARDTSIPVFAAYPSLEDWIGERPWEKPFPAGENSRAAGTFRPRQNLLIAADNVRPEGSLARFPSLGRPMTVAIGPERGWSDRERNCLEAAGFLRLSLGERALRTETACVAAAVLALEKIGELG